jgi:glucose-6-phosphate dehydrogenase assembly protein OpcA
VPAAHVQSWSGEDVRLGDVERALCRCRESEEQESGGPDIRTSVLTHLAWVPTEWRKAAEDVLEGLGERHPSRTIVLLPDPDSDRDAIDGEVSVEAFAVPGMHRHVATEVIRLRLHGARTRAPASVVLPLLISDLPVFLRWRGRPDFYAGPFEQLVEVADRLVVDTGEWPDLPAAYGALAEFFDRVQISDIAWARLAGWCQGIARLWPGVAAASTIRVEGQAAEAILLAGWLRSGLGHDVALEHVEADAVRSVAIDGKAVESAGVEPKSASDLLSDQLEIFGRDRIYEGAVAAAAEAVT